GTRRRLAMHGARGSVRRIRLSSPRSRAMPPHSVGTGTISFGLVSIPIKLYTAASAGGVSFNMLHAKCGNRIKQQTLCPVCNEVVERNQLVRGYEFSRDQDGGV